MTNKNKVEVTFRFSIVNCRGAESIDAWIQRPLSLHRMIPWFWLLFRTILFALLTAASSGAQQPDEEARPQSAPATQTEGNPTPGIHKAPLQGGNSSPVSEAGLLKNVWTDQKRIWSAPARRQSYRLSFILPFAAGTAALIATDRRVGHEITEHPAGTGFDISTDISQLGSAGAVIGFPAAYYVFSRLTRREKARETSLLAFEALADSGIVVEVLKALSQRERPAGPNGFPVDNARGRFWMGGPDFPSGHAISTWTLATVFSERYRDKPGVKYMAYGLAGLVSASRLTARQHFPSDILVGAVLGYLIGHYVVHTHRR